METKKFEYRILFHFNGTWHPISEIKTTSEEAFQFRDYARGFSDNNQAKIQKREITDWEDLDS